jgi:TRAP-type transport system periplasmic protein
MLTTSCADRAAKLVTLTLACLLFLVGKLNAGETTLRLVDNSPPSTPLFTTVSRFIEVVTPMTRGEIKIERISTSKFRSQSSGAEPGLLKLVQAGEFDLALIRSSIAEKVDVFRLFELPYLIRDRTQLRKIAETVVPAMAPNAQAIGIDVLATFDGDFNQVISRKPISKLVDFKGLRIGTLGVEARAGWGSNYFQPTIDLFYRLGAEPIALALNEVDLTGGRAELVDAVDMPARGALDIRSLESFRYMTLTRHAFTPVFLVVNLRRFSHLGRKTHDALRLAAILTQTYSIELGQDAEKAAIDQLAKRDVKLMSLDYANTVELEERSRQFYDRYVVEVGGGSMEFLSQALRSVSR